MFQYLQEMDWKTALRQAKRLEHWRVFLVAIMCALPAFGLWWILFPNTLWFSKLFGAGATGGMIGLLIGFGWQLKDPSRRAQSSGRLFAMFVFIGCAVLLPAALFYIGPTLYVEETELAKIRTMEAAEVVFISVKVPGRPRIKATDCERIIPFVKRCHRSNLFYISHESFTNESRISIHFSDGTAWTYEMGIPERHMNDLVLTFRNHGHYSHILIPDAAEWFEALEKKEEGSEVSGLPVTES